MRFKEGGMFWEPFRYEKQKTSKADKAPRIPPPIPETGWKPKEFFPDLSGAKMIAIDTETCDPDLKEKGPGPRRGAYIVGVSVATDNGFKGYYPVAHSMGDNLDKKKVYRWLKKELGRAKQPKIGANLLYDLDYLTTEGIKVKGKFYDIQYADPLIYEYHRSYSLDAIAQRLLGTGKETSLLYQWCADAYGGKVDGSQRANIWRAPVSLVGPYAEADATLPMQIIKLQMTKLREMGVASTFQLESALIPLLLDMRQRGVPLDLGRVNALDDELTRSIDLGQKKLNLDVYAADQIRQLCDKEKIEYPLTETGRPSFTKDWLSVHSHPKMREVSNLRVLYKMRDTFVRNSMLGTQIGGRVHCEFHPLRSDDYGTVSGRFSSSNPNLQQIPKRDKVWGPKLRSCYVPEEDMVWGRNDLSQIEFRLGVHYGVGENAKIVKQKYIDDPLADFYMVAAELTELIRDDAKAIALGSIYGMGKRKFLASAPDSTAEKFDQFHERLSFMRETYSHYADEAKEFGFVRTIGGRVCHLEGEFARNALNRKLQGSCADWIKKSMVDAYEAGLFEVLRLHLTVHDELDYSKPRTPEATDAMRELHHLMCSAYPVSLPVLAGIDVGPSWGELTETTRDNIEIYG